MFACRATFVEEPRADEASPPVIVTLPDGSRVASDAPDCDDVLATAFFDLFPVSVLTSSTLATLGNLRPESRFDVRRFRMNVIVDTEPSGFVENGWIGQSVYLGQEARVHVVMPDPRCVMPTLAQEELPRDNDVLRTPVRHNRLELADGARHPCAGVYAVVKAAGLVRQGDVVSSS